LRRGSLFAGSFLATRQRTFAIEARHNSADEVLYLAHEKILGPQYVGFAKLLQIVTRPNDDPTTVKWATASAKGQRARVS
jgi:hypothetical protein